MSPTWSLLFEVQIVEIYNEHFREPTWIMLLPCLFGNAYSHLAESYHTAESWRYGYSARKLSTNPHHVVTEWIECTTDEWREFVAHMDASLSLYHCISMVSNRQDLLTVADVSHNAHNATPRWLHSDGWQFSKHLHVLKNYTSHVFSDILYSMCELSGPISQFWPHEWTVASLDVVSVSKNRSHLGYIHWPSNESLPHTVAILLCYNTVQVCWSKRSNPCWGWKCSPPVAAQPYRWEYSYMSAMYVGSMLEFKTYSDSWLTSHHYL